MSYSSIRIANGSLSQYTLQNNSSYLVENFPLAADQTPAYPWRAVTDGAVEDGVLEIGLNKIGQFYGGASFKIRFGFLTKGMIAYLWTNIFNSRPANNITVQVGHPRLGDTVYNCTALWPFRAGASDYRRLDDTAYANVIIECIAGKIAIYGRAFSPAYSSAWG